MIYAHFREGTQCEEMKITNNMQALWDEFESATLAVDALTDALEMATLFDSDGIRIALKEAEQAQFSLALEMIETIGNQIEEAA